MSSNVREAAQQIGRSLGSILGLTVVVVLVWMPPALRAQSSNAQLSGLITDPTGAVIGGTKIKALNTDTNVPYTAESNGAGIYVLQELLPGPYTLSVTRRDLESSNAPDWCWEPATIWRRTSP